MKKIKNANLYYLLSAFLLSIMASACLEKEEGCRDVAATNFAADAEVDCEDCCSYPSITFEIDHAVGDTSLKYGDTIFFDDKIIKILETSFYINGISLTAADQTIRITDEITLTDRSGNTTLTTDDIEIISRDIPSFSYDLGSFRGDGTFSELNFQIGLDLIQAATNPSSVPDAHPLAPANALFDLPDSTYVFTRLRLVNVHNDDTLQYSTNTPVNINLPYTVTIDRSFDLTIPLKVDYLNWIEGINFADDSLVTTQIIVSNLSNAFSIRE